MTITENGRRIILVSDYDGPIAPVTVYPVIRQRTYTGEPYSTLIAVLGNLLHTGVQRNSRYFNMLLDVHKKHDSDPSYPHLQFVVDAHNYTGRFLHGLSVYDVNAATEEFMEKNRDELQPTHEVKQCLRDAKVYGDSIAVSGSPTFAIRAHDKKILKPYGIGFKYHIGMDPIIENGMFVGNISNGQETTRPDDFIDMVRRMDSKDDKLTEVLKVMSSEDLKNAVVFGDTTFENELFKNCGYPVMVNPNDRLLGSRSAIHYGAILAHPSYVHRFRDMLDFLYCIPRKVNVPETEIVVERKIVNRFDRRIVVSHPTRKSVEILYANAASTYEKILSERGYNSREISLLFDTLKDMKSASKKGLLQQLRPKS